MKVYQEYGFVIRNFFPHQQKISIIFRDHGKVSLPLKNIKFCRSLSPGMFVNCVFQVGQHSNFLVEHIEIAGFFSCHTHEEVAWLHHMLEIIYYFSPLNNPCHEVFLFLFHYFRIFHLVSSCKKIQKAFFVASAAKLFTLFDFQPIPAVVESIQFFEYLVTNSIDFNQLQNIKSIEIYSTMASEKKLHDVCLWGLTCIKTHPQFVHFKTTDILQ